MRERRELKREKRGKTDLEDGTNELPLAHMQLIFDRFDGSICRRTICIGHENMSQPDVHRGQNAALVPDADTTVMDRWRVAAAWF